MTVLAALVAFDGRDGLGACSAMLRAQWAGAERVDQLGSGAVALGAAVRERTDAAAVAESPDGMIVVAADARIDDRDEFYGPLGLSRGSGDRLTEAELIARCLARWGIDVLGRLIGDFALVAWDRRTERLLLARDFGGMRPLHFRRTNAMIAASSMAAGLHALDDVPRAVDQGRLAELLLAMPHRGRGSSFAGIDRVEPGEVLAIDPSRLVATPLWTPPSKVLRLKSADDYAQGLREQLDRAVKARLRGAEKVVATHLSSGFDSSAVTATAAREFSGTVLAHTAVPPARHAAVPVGRHGDEAPLAAQVARLYPAVVHTLVPMPERLELEQLPAMLAAFERPDLNLPNFAWAEAINAQASAADARILLVGTMGNGTLSYAGNGGLGEMIDFPHVAAFAAMLVASLGRGRDAGGLALEALRTALRWRRATTKRRAGLMAAEAMRQSALNPAFPGAATLRQRLQDTAAGRIGQGSIATRVDMLRRVDMGTFVKATQLRWNIELRDPTADRNLVDFCLQVPLIEFLRGGHARALARRALADRLPGAVLYARERGLQAPHWFDMLSRERADVERILATASPQAARLLDLAKLRALSQTWPDPTQPGPPQYRYGLLRGLVMAEFMRING